jgi:hypothetical protein
MFSLDLTCFGAKKISKSPVGRGSLMGIDTYLEEPSRGTFHCPWADLDYRFCGN